MYTNVQPSAIKQRAFLVTSCTPFWTYVTSRVNLWTLCDTVIHRVTYCDNA